MKKLCVFAVATITMSVLLTGCTGGGGDDGIKPSVNNAMSDLNSMATKADGKWSALKPEEQQKFLAMYGTEAEAKKMLNLMAHPPNAKPPKKN